MKDPWKIIKECKFKNMRECVEMLLKKNYQVSHWIRDIAKRTETDFKNIKFPVTLIRVKVSELGIKSATTLKTIYSLLENMKINDAMDMIISRLDKPNKLKEILK